MKRKSSTRQDNEEKFRSAFKVLYGVGHLNGKKRYVDDSDLKDVVEISSDDSLEQDGWLVLIEVDSYTSTKPALGQYVLLNTLCTHDPRKTLVLVIHYGKGFNADRTMKNLKFVGPLLIRQPALAYQAFTHENFFRLCRLHPDVCSLVRALIALATGNGES